MRREQIAIVVAVAALLGACGHGSPQHSGDPPAADQVYGQCAFCHVDLATAMVAHGGHANLEIKCVRCHDDLTPGVVGCGHRGIPLCSDCHREQITHHDPAVAAPQQCTICHTPHGSPNLVLIRTEVPLSGSDNTVAPCTTEGDCMPGQACAGTNATCGMPTRTGGCAAPIVLDNLGGLVDGGFASASQPGTGLCETCHTTTRYYRGDGTGEAHFPFPCYTCHPHPLGFLPSS